MAGSDSGNSCATQRAHGVRSGGGSPFSEPGSGTLVQVVFLPSDSLCYLVSGCLLSSNANVTLGIGSEVELETL